MFLRLASFFFPFAKINLAIGLCMRKPADFQLAPRLVVDYTHNLQLTASLLAAPLVVTPNIVALTASWVVLSILVFVW